MAQPEVFITTFGDGTQTNFRVSTGIVIRYSQRDQARLNQEAAVDLILPPL